jgi:hypothetical protein
MQRLAFLVTPRRTGVGSLTAVGPIATARRVGTRRHTGRAGRRAARSTGAAAMIAGPRLIPAR